MNVIPCMAWVKRGAASEKPDRVRLARKDLASLMHMPPSDFASNQPLDSDDGEDSDDSVGKRYNLSSYDDGDEDDVKALREIIDTTPDDREDDADSDDSEADDIRVMPDDNMLIVCKVSDQFPTMETHIYNQAESNIYCHHDSMLEAFPLAVEWMNFDPGEASAGNLVAVASMSPSIDIWDIDVVGSMEPAFQMGEQDPDDAVSGEGHTDAILDLAWNSKQRQILASASADFTIGLWDMSEGKMVSSLTDHTDKVQTLEWHIQEAQTLLSGGFDGTVRMYDCRTEDTSKSWTLGGEVERVKWDQHNAFQFYTGDDQGALYLYDVRHDLKPLFTLSAHPGDALSGLAVSRHLAGCVMTTGGSSVKLWDTRDACKPRIVYSTELKIGDITCAEASPDSLLTFALAGERQFRIIDLENDHDVTDAFGLDPKQKSLSKSAQKKQVILMGATEVDSDIEGSGDDVSSDSEAEVAAPSKQKSSAKAASSKTVKCADKSKKSEVVEKKTKKPKKKVKKMKKPNKDDIATIVSDTKKSVSTNDATLKKVKTKKTTDKEDKSEVKIDNKDKKKTTKKSKKVKSTNSTNGEEPKLKKKKVKSET